MALHHLTGRDPLVRKTEATFSQDTCHLVPGQKRLSA